MRATGLLVVLLLWPLTAGAAEIVVEAGALTPAVLTVETDEPVSIVNRSGRVVHIDLLGRGDEHHVFQVPGRIQAVFHRPGRHPYVVHFETAPRGELRGAVDVRERATPRDDAPVCRGISVDEICLEP
jgi:hypothetical protein